MDYSVVTGVKGKASGLFAFSGLIFISQADSTALLHERRHYPDVTSIAEHVRSCEYVKIQPHMVIRNSSCQRVAFPPKVHRTAMQCSDALEV